MQTSSEEAVSGLVYFNAPSGRIEGKHYCNELKTAPIALVLHPDPTQGGTMNNKVAYTAFRAFVESGYSVLRINLPGVGKSSGVMGNMEDDVRAAAAALDWLRHVHPAATSVAICGYSRGSNIAAHVAVRRPEIEEYIFIAPPLNHYSYDFFTHPPLPGLIISAEKDELVSESLVKERAIEWSKRKDYQADYIVILGAKHSFEGHLNEVYEKCIEYLKERLSMKILKPVRKKRRRRKKRERGHDDGD